MRSMNRATITELLKSSSITIKRLPRGSSWRRLQPKVKTYVLVTLLGCAVLFFALAPSSNYHTAKRSSSSSSRDEEGDAEADSRSSTTGASASAADTFEATTTVGDHKSGRPLVAVYFTGQARTLNRTICSIAGHLFAPLVRQGFTPVVFVVGESDGNEAGSFLHFFEL